MLRFPIVAAVILGGLLGATIGVAFSANKFGHAGTLAEFKVVAGNLNADPAPSGQLREYLKARLYYVAMSLSPQDVGGIRIDYGPIDEVVLGRIDPRGEPVPYDQLYHDVQERYHLKPQR